MYPIQIVRSTDHTKSGHLYCSGCVEELNVVLAHTKMYSNPNYKIAWNMRWNEFHNVRLVYPEVLKALLKKLQHMTCPCCSESGKIYTMTNGTFDIALIKRSLRQVHQPKLFYCIRCEGEFSSEQHVAQLPDTDDYVCGDCAIAAQHRLTS